jgi:uncharacterized protein
VRIGKPRASRGRATIPAMSPLIELPLLWIVEGEMTAFALRVVAATVFGAAGLGCVVLTVIGLPGLWLLLLLMGALQWSDRWLRSGGSTFDVWTLLAAVGVAVAVEVYEFSAGASGARQAGASKRGAIGALVGGLVGAIAGAPFGLIVGALVGGVIGSAIGAIVMELTLPHQTLQGSLKPAQGAAMGRLKGIAAKLLVTTVLWIALTVAIVVE